MCVCVCVCVSVCVVCSYWMFLLNETHVETTTTGYFNKSKDS